MNDLFPLTQAAHDPGGKSKPRWPADSVISAQFGGPNDCYRYKLSETWDLTLPAVMFLLMNPSTATVNNADPTLLKTGTFARSWGFGCQYIANVHAYRATDSLNLAAAADPIGPDNDAAILSMARRAEYVVLAYGKPKVKALHARGPEVVRMLRGSGVRLAYLRLSKDFTPWHPLYLPGSSVPIAPTPDELRRIAGEAGL